MFSSGCYVRYMSLPVICITYPGVLCHTAPSSAIVEVPMDLDKKTNLVFAIVNFLNAELSAALAAGDLMFYFIMNELIV